MSNIIITEEQFFKITNKLFNTLYTKVRYKNDKRRLSVYEGDKLRRYSTNGKKPTYMMEYYPDEGTLWISDYTYSEMKKLFPPVSNNLLFFDFFKKWFENKFGITPKKVNIFNQASLNNKYNG